MQEPASEPKDVARSAAAEAGPVDAFWERLFDAVGRPMLAVDLSLRVLRANPAFVETFGATREALEGKPLGAEWGADGLLKLIGHRSSQSMELRLQGPDGASRLVNLQAQRINGDGVALIEFVDRTLEAAAEETLRASEARYRALAEATTHSIYRLSADGSQVFALDESPSQTSSTAEYIHPDDLPAAAAAWMHALATKTAFQMEHRALLDGRWGWVVSRAVPVLGPDGEVAEWIGSLTDVTEQRQAVEALRASEARFRSLFESIDEGFAIMDVILGDDGRVADLLIVATNPAFERLTELTNVVGRTIEEVAPAPDRAWMQHLGSVVKTGEPVRFEEWTPRRGRYYEFYAFRPEESEENRVALLFQDVTVRKEAEQAQAEREEQLLNANRIKDEFLGLVSHELRTPLTVILGNALALASHRGLSPEESDAALTDIVKEAVRLQRIIENLLMLTRLENRQAELEPVSLPSLIYREVAAFAHNRPSRKATVKVSDDAPVALGQERFITEVLENLLSNADKYSPGHEAIEVDLHTNDQGEPEVTVRDRGIGVAENELESIFEPFYRAKTATATAQGMGLGLSVCRRLIEAQGGRIWARAREGGGVEFSFALPSAE